MSPETITIAATAVGYVAGQVFETNAVHRVAQARERLVAIGGDEFASSDDSRTTSFLGRAVVRGLVPLALVAGVASGAEVYGWLPGELHHPQAATLEIAVDHSGATSLDLGGKPPVDQINGIVDKLIGDNLRSEAIVAGSSQIHVVRPTDVKRMQPFGDAPLEQAVTLGLDKAVETATSRQQRANGVLIITNGNSIGHTAALTAKAREQHTPVFVVNVENNGKTAAATARSLQSIAKQTGGKYWEANSGTADKVAKSVEAALVPQDSRTPVPNRNLFKAWGLLAGVGAVEIFRRRKNMTLQSQPKRSL